jgi:hypothetical protein
MFPPTTNSAAYRDRSGEIVGQQEGHKSLFLINNATLEAISLNQFVDEDSMGPFRGSEVATHESRTSGFNILVNECGG